MTILVLNGSPKGENSITLQYVRYLERALPRHRFEVLHVAWRIHRLEHDPAAFDEVLAKVAAADAVLWAFGLWVLCVPAQLMRFIELLGERGRAPAFAGKPTAVLSTSIHYYDHTAHRYLRAVCEDLEMRFTVSASFDMTDLREDEGRRRLVSFGETFLGAAEQGWSSPRQSAPLPTSELRFSYRPSPPTRRVNPRGHRLLLLTDSSDPATNQQRMLERFRAAFTGGELEVIDLQEVEIAGGCLGCMRCGYDYRCRYRDGFTDFYNQKVRGAEILVLCGSINGRYLSSRWKTFFDRAFFWNHTPSLAGKQIAFLVSGPLRQNPHLAEILEASVTARQLASFVGIVSDEDGDSGRLDALLDSLAERLVHYAESGYVAPRDFLAVGGLKIFRDEIWGRLRGIWQADYRHYRKHGFFDFPQRRWLMLILSCLLILLCKIPAVRRRFYARLQLVPARRLGRLAARAAIQERESRPALAERCPSTRPRALSSP